MFIFILITTNLFYVSLCTSLFVRVLLKEIFNLLKFCSVGDKFMEHWRDDTEKLIPKHVEGNLLQHQSVHHKSHVTWSRICPGPPR